MPGIVGIISNTSDKRNGELLKLMIDSMMHEPFYRSGIYTNKELGIYCGLVGDKESPSCCMPIFKEKKDIVLLFSGENFIENDEILNVKLMGHNLDRCNSGYLVHLYEEDNQKFFAELNGWFSGVLVDIEKGKINIFNDRFGIERIYYHESNEGFFFSTEAKAILKAKPELRKMNEAGLAEYFQWGCTLDSKTLFSGIYTLPGGSLWTFQNGKNTKKGTYFEPKEWEHLPKLGREAFYSRFSETYSNILPKYFRAKEKIGFSLTGGLDTRLILACREAPAGSLPCYTFGDPVKESNDIKIARKVAKALGQEYHVIKIGKEFLREFPTLAEKTIYITDGCFGVCGTHEIYLNRLARDIAPIRMTGNYGSEVLRSVSQFKISPLCREIFGKEFDKYPKEAGNFTNDSHGAKSLSFSLFKEIPWLYYGRLFAAQSQLTVRSPYLDNELIKLMFQCPGELRVSNELSLLTIREKSNLLSGIPTDRGVRINGDNLFGKLNRLYLEFLFKGEYFASDGLPKWAWQGDHLLKSLGLLKILLGRHRYLFYGKWFQRELAEYIKGVLLDRRSMQRPYLNKYMVEKIVFDHIKGKSNYLAEIEKLISAELIHRLLIENV